MDNIRPIDRTLPRPASIEAGPAPMLQWIDIDLLVVDDDYQRGLQENNWRAIRRISDQFDWSKFSTVHVAPIEGGRFAIIDGQHRTHAAAACGFSQVPCQITPMSKSEQASAFAAINGAVTAVTMFQIYKAALTAGEQWAVVADRVASESGCELMRSNQAENAKKAGEIFAIKYFRDVIERRGADAVGAALLIVRAAEGVGDVKEYWTYQMLRPILEALCGRPHIMMRPQESTRFLEDFDLWQAADEASAFVAERRRQGLPSMSRLELLETLIGDAMDKAMPQRVALPSPEVAA